jgi:hypothetical protein
VARRSRPYRLATPSALDLEDRVGRIGRQRVLPRQVGCRESNEGFRTVRLILQTNLVLLRGFRRELHARDVVGPSTGRNDVE